jgi:hypothetical protein
MLSALGANAPKGQESGNPRLQVTEIDRLPEVIACPAAQGLDDDLLGADPRHEDDHGIREEALDDLKDRRARKIREPVVEEDQVEGVGAEGFEGGRGAGGRMDLVGGRKRSYQGLLDPGIVVNNEKTAGGAHWHPSPGCFRVVRLMWPFYLPPASVIIFPARC